MSFLFDVVKSAELIKEIDMNVKIAIICVIIGFLGVSCKMVEKSGGCQKEARSYTVKRLGCAMKIDADWDKPQWKGVEPVTLGCYMGDKPEHFPLTQAKVMYDDANLYVIFKVEDRYVRAVGQGYQAKVCLDSCAEFFFTPSDDVSQGYFNVEANCGGAMLLYHQMERGVGLVPVADEDMDKIEVAHSMPKLVTEEITEPTTWTLEYRLPVSMFAKYAPVIMPKSGAEWKANFYKCGDLTSHPHWLTWSFVDKPKPDFHRPEFFGTLVFE